VGDDVTSGGFEVGVIARVASDPLHATRATENKIDCASKKARVNRLEEVRIRNAGFQPHRDLP